MQVGQQGLWSGCGCWLCVVYRADVDVGDYDLMTVRDAGDWMEVSHSRRWGSGQLCMYGEGSGEGLPRTV